MFTTKFQFLFQEIDSEESLIRLAQFINAIYDNGTIRIPAPSGSGIIRLIKIEEGLYLRVWDFELSKPFIFSKKPVGISADRKFHLSYLLNPETLVMKKDEIGKEFRVQPGMNIFFASDNIDIDIEIAREKGLHGIDLSFTASWLLKAFAEADTKMNVFINQLLQSITPTAFFESASPIEYRAMQNLHTSALNRTYDFLQIKAGVLFLLSEFFNKIFSKSTSEVFESNFLYYDKMKEVEKLLIAHLQKKLPPIDAIARQMAMSESTLKRHFKPMFGKSIYEYYLELKMDFAKRLLMEKMLSVGEVAAMLEYDKVSNFIEMFKRHHGVSPGALQRQVGKLKR